MLSGDDREGEEASAAARSAFVRSLDDVVNHSKISQRVSTHDLESSIKAFCDTADLHLEKLYDLHNDTTTRPVHHSSTDREEWNPNSHSSSTVNRRANASMNASSSRIHAHASGSTHNSSIINRSGTAMNHGGHLDATVTMSAAAAEPTSSMGRKIDLLMRRQKVLEERVKETQGNNERLVEDFASQSEVIKRMAETHRNDRRLIGLLSEQVQSLKNDREIDFQQLRASPHITRDEVDSIMESKLGKAAALCNIDFEQVKSNLKEQLQKTFANQLRVAVDNVVREQQTMLTKWTDQYNANLSIPITLGRELTSFQESIKSIAMRQSTTDATIAKFSESLMKQNEQISVTLSESVDKYKKEMQAVLDSVGRKINDHLNATSTHIDASLSSIDDRIGDFNQKLIDEQTIMQAVSRRLAQLEIDQKDSVSQVNNKLNSTLASVVRTESTVDKLANDVDQLETKISLIKFEISEAEAASRKAIDSIVDSVDGTRAFCENSMQMLSNSYTEFEESTALSAQEALAGVEVHAALSKQNAEGLLSLRSLLEEKFSANSDELESYKEELSRTVSTLFESDKRTRMKIKEIYDQFTSVSQTRSAVDRVLHEVNERSKEDSVWTYHFKNLAETLDGRLRAVEKMVPQSLRSLQERLFDIESKVASLRQGAAPPSSSSSSQQPAESTQAELAAVMQEMLLIRNDVKLFLQSHEKKKEHNNNNNYNDRSGSGSAGNEQAAAGNESIAIKARLDDCEARLLAVESFIVRTSEDIMTDGQGFGDTGSQKGFRSVSGLGSAEASVSPRELCGLGSVAAAPKGESPPKTVAPKEDALEGAKRALFQKKAAHREAFRRRVVLPAR